MHAGQGLEPEIDEKYFNSLRNLDDPFLLRFIILALTNLTKMELPSPALSYEYRSTTGELNDLAG